VLRSQLHCETEPAEVTVHGGTSRPGAEIRRYHGPDGRLSVAL